MKLELRESDDAATLFVHESITTGDVAVLRAGIGKMAASGKRIILLDLQKAGEPAPEVLTQLRTIPDSAANAGGIVFLIHASADEKRSDEFKTPEEALGLLADPERRMDLEIRMYTAWNIALDVRRKALEAELKSMGAGDQESIAVRTSISRLRRRIRFFERRLSTWVAKSPYKEKRDTREARQSDAAALAILGILEQAGILKGLIPAATEAPKP